MRQLTFLILLFLTIPGLFGAEEGLASWYGGKFQGRLTANGERFDTNKLTAAHKTLPFNTMVRVTNLETGRHVEVRINDRGPFVEGRIIDLSRAAAEEIGMTGQGVAKVRVEPLTSLKSPLMRIYIIQVGAYSIAENAREVKDRLRAEGLPVILEKAGDGIFRVQVVNIMHTSLESTKSKLKKLGFNSLLIRQYGG